MGNTLSEPSRRQLETWLVRAKIGADRLPAGLPQAWRVGHKTGTGPGGATNDVAAAWPGNKGKPILVAAFYAGSEAPLDQRNSVLAEVGRIAARFAAGG